MDEAYFPSAYKIKGVLLQKKNVSKCNKVTDKNCYATQYWNKGNRLGSLGVLSGWGEKARQQSRTMWTLSTSSTNAFDSCFLPRSGETGPIISKTPFLLYYSMILRDKQFVIQIMITLHQKNTLEMSNYRICRQDVRGRNLLECAFEKTYKPGFVNSKGKEERTQFIPHCQGYLYFSHFLSLSPIYFSIYSFIQHFPEYFLSAILLPYPEGTITQSSGSQSVVPQTSRVNITWKRYKFVLLGPTPDPMNQKLQEQSPNNFNKLSR